MPINILTMDENAMKRYFEEQNQPGYRLQQVFKGIYVKEWEDFSQFSDMPKSLRTQLATDFILRSFKLVDTIISQKDETTKFLWELSDGRKVESVIIYEGRRVTFCISSQVGCPLDCKFCATAKMGLIRDLTSAEIVEQVMQMKKRSKYPPTNIVYMGMGEPFLNYDQVIKAAHRISDPDGLCFNRKKITISTSGVIKNIYRMAEEDQPFSLAISLNAVDPQVREKIMPISRKYPVDQLIKAAKHYTKTTGRQITFEYVLIKDVNSSEKDAHDLVKLTHGLPCKINIIPCNSDDPEYQPPDDEAIDVFDRIVNDKNRSITIRNRKGWEIQAACGQLFAENSKRKKQIRTDTFQFK